jgi:hypothetical protein
MLAKSHAHYMDTYNYLLNKPFANNFLPTY